MQAIRGRVPAVALMLGLLAASLPVISGRSASAATIGAILVNTIHTSAFSPPSPDPAGITYDAANDRLLITDSEVDEELHWQGANVWHISRSGSVLATGTTTSFSKEPTGISLNPDNQHAFIADDNKKTVHEIDPGTDGRYGTGDDGVVTKFQTEAFGSLDPEDLVFVPSSAHLFVLDGAGNQVYEVSPGTNGVFDGVAPTGDDTVTDFDVGVHGLADPEGITYNLDRSTLFIVNHQTDAVYEFTTSGELINTISISQARPRKAAGLTFAPGSSDPERMNLYIVDRGVDNSANPSENDGKLYEMSIDFPTSGSALDIPVAQQSDDAEERPNGGVNLRSADLQLVVFNGSRQTVGLRFTDISIPQGTSISSAHVQFQVDEVSTGSSNLTIAGQASDDAATFAQTASNISSRPQTSASVAWSPPPWGTVGEAGPDQQTPDLAAVLQEIVSRPGWAAGNDLVLIITGRGKRVAESFEGGAPPTLHIEY